MIANPVVHKQIQSSPTESNRRALLVEDDCLVAMVVEEGLRDLGFEPHIVGSAAEAVAAMAGGLNPSLAVIDVGLPDERGDNLATRLLALYPKLCILIASGYDAGELRSRFSEHAAVRVLGKPYTGLDLAEAVGAFGFED